MIFELRKALVEAGIASPAQGDAFVQAMKRIAEAEHQAEVALSGRRAAEWDALPWWRKIGRTRMNYILRNR